MDILSTLLIAIGLAMDCFAVSLCIGTGSMEKTKRNIFRIAFHFGLFQGGCPGTSADLGTECDRGSCIPAPV